MNDTTHDSMQQLDQDDSIVELGVASQSTQGFSWGKLLDGVGGFWA